MDSTAALKAATVDHMIDRARSWKTESAFSAFLRGEKTKASKLRSWQRRRIAWVAAVRRKDFTFNRIPDHMRVCSRHFQSGAFSAFFILCCYGVKLCPEVCARTFLDANVTHCSPLQIQILVQTVFNVCFYDDVICGIIGFNLYNFCMNRKTCIWNDGNWRRMAQPLVEEGAQEMEEMSHQGENCGFLDKLLPGDLVLAETNTRYCPQKSLLIWFCAVKMTKSPYWTK